MQPTQQLNLPGQSVSSPSGLILHLQRFSTEDGPGLRTTVFLKGCPLHCEWCHNPESISPRRQVHWLENRCIGCLTCLDVCPLEALQLSAGGIVRNRKLCQVCGTCAQRCPANAHEMLGRSLTIADLLPELLKDKVYFQKSGGGVTLSGGEPALQPDFARGLLESLQDSGISTALDTCGHCSYEVLEHLVECSNLVLYDLKHIDPLEHRRLTRVDNMRIFDNLLRLAGYLQTHPEKSLWIRTPLIPGATFIQSNLKGIAGWLAAHVREQVERWELCSFNNLCRDKYLRLDLAWDYAEAGLLSPSDLILAQEWASGSGFPADRIFVTGAARLYGANRC